MSKQLYNFKILFVKKRVRKGWHKSKANEESGTVTPVFASKTLKFCCQRHSQIASFSNVQKKQQQQKKTSTSWRQITISTRCSQHTRTRTDLLSVFITLISLRVIPFFAMKIMLETLERGITMIKLSIWPSKNVRTKHINENNKGD